MKELKNKILNYLLFFSVLLFVSCSVDEPVSVNAPMLEKQIKSNEDDCTINQELMLKYLRLSRKDTALTSLEKVVRDGKTVAYLAKYQKGWELLAADKRQPIVLASANVGSIEFTDDGHSSNSLIDNLLTDVQKHVTENINKHPIWGLLEMPTNINKISPQKIHPTSFQGDGGERGMWVVDSVKFDCNIEEDTIPLISTNWHQDDPYNQYVPYVYNSSDHCKAGCVPVAVGQVIAYYRKNDPRGYLIPEDVTVTPNHSSVVFMNYSDSLWSSILNEGTASVFISYLGAQMGTHYGEHSSQTSYTDMKNILENYGLSYNESSYNFQSVLTSLRTRRPVLVNGESQSEGNHAFIIKNYKRHVVNYKVFYSWDPDYPVTDWERQTMDPCLFIEPVSYTERIDEHLLQDDVYFQMNWGWKNELGMSPSDYYNNIWFNVYSYASSPEEGTVYSVTRTPNWSPEAGETYTVNHILYNIRNR